MVFGDRLFGRLDIRHTKRGTTDGEQTQDSTGNCDGGGGLHGHAE